MAQRANRRKNNEGHRRSILICTSEDFSKLERPLHCGVPMVCNGATRFKCNVCGYQPVRKQKERKVEVGPPCLSCGHLMYSSGKIQWICKVCHKWIAKHKYERIHLLFNVA